MKLPATTKGRGGSPFSRATRFIWVRLPWHQITVSVPFSKSGKFQEVILTLTRGTNQSVTINLTSLTLPELLALRESVLIATEVAEPIVRRLDLEAQEKMEHEGDDSNDRVYRGLPTVVIRKGALGQYDEGVLQRRDDVLQGIGTQLLSGGGPPEVGSAMDEHPQEDPVTEDKSS